MKRCLIWIVLLSTIYFTNTTTEALAEKLSELRVSENGRFLIRKDGSGFFPLADTAWAIAWRLNRSEVEMYLQRRKDQKFNMIALIAFPSYRSNITTNVYRDNAFEVISGKYNPLRPIITPGESPENSIEYDYWDHLEYIIDASESKGMYVVLLPAWGSRVAGDWGNGKATPEIIFNSTNSYKYGRWIGQRFKSKKNIIWMMGGDRSAVYGDKDYRNVFRAMAEGVADGVNEINQQDTKADYSTTLMSYHPRKWMPPFYVGSITPRPARRMKEGELGDAIGILKSYVHDYRDGYLHCVQYLKWTCERCGQEEDVSTNGISFHVYEISAGDWRIVSVVVHSCPGPECVRTEDIVE